VDLVPVPRFIEDGKFKTERFALPLRAPETDQNVTSAAL
jgi:hypothetical protein